MSLVSATSVGHRPALVNGACSPILARRRFEYRFGMDLATRARIFAALLCLSCSKPEARTPVAFPSAPAAGAPARPVTGPSADARLTERPVAARPELARAFDEERVQGGIVLFDAETGELFASDPALAKRPFHPASTFKIPHAAIALELGLLEDPESHMPWDGRYSTNEDWNRDHTLRTAMQVSCLPCFQRLAKSIGPEREQEWLQKLEYGNHDASGKVETFWLVGALRITPVEQLDFLRRLDTGKLPISTRTLDIVKDVIALDVRESYVLYGKTGLVGPPEIDAEVGWFVGFVALENKSVYFATVVTGHAPGVDVKPVRRRVTERVLRALGVLPS
jgi:beta-lactamase class D